MRAIMGILFTVLALPAFAQEQQNKADTIPFKHIVVPAADIQYVVDVCVVYPIKYRQTIYPNLINTPGTYTLTRQDIERIPYDYVNDLMGLFPGVYQSQRGADISVYGSRK